MCATLVLTPVFSDLGNNRKAEALWGAGIGWPGFVRVANSVSGARFIPPTETQINKILKKRDRH